MSNPHSIGTKSPEWTPVSGSKSVSKSPPLDSPKTEVHSDSKTEKSSFLSSTKSQVGLLTSPQTLDNVKTEIDHSKGEVLVQRDEDLSGQTPHLSGELSQKQFSPVTKDMLHDQIRTFDMGSLHHVDKSEKSRPRYKGLAKVQVQERMIDDQSLDRTLTHGDKEQFQRIDSSDLSDQIIRPSSKTISQIVGSRFSGFEHDLRSKLVNTGKVTGKAEVLARQIMQQTDPDSEFLLKINGMSDDELRTEVSKAVGGLRSDRYGVDSTYDQLSSKKQALVDSIVRGLHSGSNERLVDTATALKDQAVRVMTRELEGVDPNSDKAFGWSLKSGNDIQAEFAVKLGWISQDKIQECVDDAILDRNPDNLMNWKNQLTPLRQEALTAIAKGMTETLDRKIPNRAQGMQTLNYTYKGVPHSQEVPSSFTLNGQEYDTPKYINQGGLGLILEYSSKSNPEDKVIVKSLLDPLKREEMAQELIAHRHILGGEQLQTDPNIVTLRGVVKGPGDGLFMVMDKAEGGDLEAMSLSLSLASKMGGLPHTARVLLSQHYLKESALGLAKVQSSGSMHNDVKDKNYLIHKGHVLLSDFGSTHTRTRMDKTGDTPTTFGGPEWKDGPVDQKNDMYALGVMLHRMHGGDIPSLGKTLTANPDDNTALGRLKKGLLAEKPEDRITPQGILDSDYIRTLDSVPQSLLGKLVQQSEELSKLVGGELLKLDDKIANLEHVVGQLQRRYDTVSTLDHPDLETVQAVKNDLDNYSLQLTQAKQAQSDLLARPEVKQLLEAMTETSREIDAKRTLY